MSHPGGSGRQPDVYSMMNGKGIPMNNPPGMGMGMGAPMDARDDILQREMMKFETNSQYGVGNVTGRNSAVELNTSYHKH